MFRVSAVRASLANGRRASRASYAAGSRRVSHLTRSRTSVANANGSDNNNAAAAAGVGSGSASPCGSEMGGAVSSFPVMEGDNEGGDAAENVGGLGSRRESAISMVSGLWYDFDDIHSKLYRPGRGRSGAYVVRWI